MIHSSKHQAIHVTSPRIISICISLQLEGRQQVRDLCQFLRLLEHVVDFAMVFMHCYRPKFAQAYRNILPFRVSWFWESLNQYCIIVMNRIRTVLIPVDAYLPAKPRIKKFVFIFQCLEIHLPHFPDQKVSHPNERTTSDEGIIPSFMLLWNILL